MTDASTAGSEPCREWILQRGREQLGSTTTAAPATATRGAPAPTVTRALPPIDFPSSVPVDTITFTDWSTYVSVPDVRVARVADVDDIVAVCNWAAQSQYTVRAVGHGHNWSPLLLARDTPAGSKIMLIDTSQLDACSFDTSSGHPLATFGTGITLDAASAYLATLDNGGDGAAPGYAFPQLPAPGNLSLGGALAIGAHGTLVPSTGSGDDVDMMSCLSNLITGFDAVVTEPGGAAPHTYAVRHFDRADTDAAAFLVHLGRAFITSVTLLVEPNYYLQLHCLFPDAADLFAAPDAPVNADNPTFSSLLDTYGRIEVLWFPYNTKTFVQCNRRQPSKIEPQVTGPYNYPWMNSVSHMDNLLIKAALQFDPSWSPRFTEGEFVISFLHQNDVVLNGTARDLEIYLQDTTLRVSLFGWALQLPRGDVQDVASRFFQQLTSMLATCRTQGSYPINAAAEIRCTSVDVVRALPGTGVAAPTLAATRPVAPDDDSIDTVIWLNVGTITGTPGANEFYTELETWIIDTWGNETPDRLRPEWSKAWAYTDQGPWTNTAVIDRIRATYNQPSFGTSNFDWAAATLAGYDAAGLFTSPLLDALFGLTPTS